MWKAHPVPIKLPLLQHLFINLISLASAMLSWIYSPSPSGTFNSSCWNTDTEVDWQDGSATFRLSNQATTQGYIWRSDPEDLYLLIDWFVDLFDWEVSISIPFASAAHKVISQVCHSCHEGFIFTWRVFICGILFLHIPLGLSHLWSLCSVEFPAWPLTYFANTPLCTSPVCIHAASFSGLSTLLSLVAEQRKTGSQNSKSLPTVVRWLRRRPKNVK